MLELWQFIIGAGTVLLGGVVWAIRQEGILRSERENRIRFEAHVATFYATKQGLSELEGAVKVVGHQLPDMKATLARIDAKMDSFLVAAVRTAVPSHTYRNEDR